ncbi:MAG: sigma-70 family RNA polymerase sigma factor, partial [Candidatus Woesearchaeota archaeon]|nr:sigma-70 family RNA polymerase sigma factor [Candidatus Woesearchaeota archaeon]
MTLSPEEIERSKTVLEEYVLSHPHLTYEEIRGNRDISNVLRSLYKGKIKRALYDIITRGSDLKDVPAQDFRSLVSYMVSKIRHHIEKSGLPIPPLEDMKQDGMVGVLKAQQKSDSKYALEQNSAFLRKSIEWHIWNGLEYSFSPVRFPKNLIKGVVNLHRYKFSAAEAKKTNIRESLESHSEKTLDQLVRLSKKRYKGMKFLANIADSSEEREEDRSAVRSDLEVLMSRLSERDKEVLFSRLKGQTLEEIGAHLGLTDVGVYHIEQRS